MRLVGVDLVALDVDVGACLVFLVMCLLHLVCSTLLVSLQMVVFPLLLLFCLCSDVVPALCLLIMVVSK